MKDTRLKLIALLMVLALLGALLGKLLAGTTGALLGALLLPLAGISLAWRVDSIVLGVARAHPLRPDELPWLTELVHHLADQARMPAPHISITRSATPNAFVTGRSQTAATVVVTTGLTQLLTREELAGVLAHELAHIKQQDTLLAALTAVLAGQLVRPFYRGHRGRLAPPPGPVGRLWWRLVAPVARLLLHIGPGSHREYRADEAGAAILGDPLPLASALEKTEWATRELPMRCHPIVVPLFFVNPLSDTDAPPMHIHPPPAERVARLRALACHSPVAAPVQQPAAPTTQADMLRTDGA